jgi:uncharacterized membrane protein
MKKKSNTKTKAPILSRLTQKTFITIAAFALLMSGAMALKHYFDILQMGDSFKFALYSLYPITSIAGPLLSFGIVYIISREKVTKLWRVCKAVMITVIAVILQTFITMINTSAFASPMGYGETAAVPYAYLFEALPVVLSIVLAAVLSLVVSKAKEGNVSDASKVLQKLFLFSILLIGVGQPILSSMVQIGDPQSVSIEVHIFDMLTSLIVPAVILGIVYLVTSKQHTVSERVFITLFYAVMAVMLMMSLLSAPYLFISPSSNAFNTSWVGMYLPGIMALVMFVGIVAWHKMKKAI